jgi:CubicO group peptidase (beta-lactamase class C family)
VTPLLFKLHYQTSIRRFAGATLSLLATLALASSIVSAQQQESVDARLKGFDSYMEQVMKDWNAPGIAIGIVMGDKLVFAKGYGFRDYGKKLPYTINTAQPIASNTKLFTTVAVAWSSRRENCVGTNLSSSSFPRSGSTTTTSIGR